MLRAADIDVDRIKSIVLERLTGPDPDTGEVYDTEGWELDVRLVAEEVDEDTGEIEVSANAVVIAKDLGNPSNVLVVTMNGYEIEEVG